MSLFIRPSLAEALWRGPGAEMRRDCQFLASREAARVFGTPTVPIGVAYRADPEGFCDSFVSRLITSYVALIGA